MKITLFSNGKLQEGKCAQSIILKVLCWDIAEDQSLPSTLIHSKKILFSKLFKTI